MKRRPHIFWGGGGDEGGVQDEESDETVDTPKPICTVPNRAVYAASMTRQNFVLCIEWCGVFFLPEQG